MSSSSSMERRRSNGAGVEEEEEKEEKALMFAVGAEVEVRIDDPGFDASFYEATVVDHISMDGGGGGYAVVYSTLERDGVGGAGSAPLLREEVRAADVRPRPPVVRATPAGWAGFAMHEMVEAFYHEGWWSGVVSGLPEPAADAETGGDRRRRMYTVAFPTSREAMEFGETALRPHLVFDGRQWVPAADVDNGSPLFIEGNQVEVSRWTESFGKCWNPATVLKIIGSTNFLVEYIHAGKDGELVTEIIDSQYIRPAREIIRMDSKYRFSPSSHVEVFHEGSWWPGIILEASSSGLSKKYSVKMKRHGTGMDDVELVDMLTVEHTKLRSRFDWIGRKWIRHLTKKPVIKGKPKLSSERKPISSVLASCSGSAEIKDERSSYFDKMMTTAADVVSQPISSLLSLCDDTDVIKDKPSSCPEDTVKQQNAVLALASQSAFPLQSSMGGSGHLKCPEDTVKQQNVVLALASQSAFPLQSSMGGSDHLKYDSSVILSSHVELQSASHVMLAMPQHGESHSSMFGLFGKLRSIPQGPSLGMQSSKSDFGIIKRSKKALTEQKKQSTVGGNHLISSTENNFNVGSVAGFDISTKRKECASFQAQENPDTTKKNRVDKTIEGANNSAPISVEYAKPILSDEDVVLHNDVIAGSSQSIENSTITQLSSFDMSQPIDTEYGNNLTIPNDVQGTPMSKYVARTQDSSCPLLQKSLLMHENIMTDRPSEALAINLPFMKTSPVWIQIEAMEIFNKMPQQPHFLKLQHHGLDLREGMALGLMFSFANLAESIKRLNVYDGSNVFEEKMKSISLLEADGFNVSHLRSRLQTLLGMKNEFFKMQDMLKQLEKKIAHKETDDQQLCTQISMLNMVVRQLDQHAYLFRHLKQCAISRKMSEAIEIQRLKVEASELKESYVSIEQNFKNVVTAPW